ncbi:MAG: hypothetical protein JST54_18235 [Deltaproteobacteria bacterium]|nr:hypothetical protein [Deltaproteobacteria bacterium]
MRALPAIALATLLAACSSPPVQTSADRLNTAITTTLSGQVVVAGGARGDAVILLYEAAHPPAPFGTGHPIAFALVPASTLFAGALHDGNAPGPFAASYTFPTVAPGTYLVAAFLDSDACLTGPSTTCQLSDFDPFYIVTREPNGHDQLGGHVDQNGQLLPVLVPQADPDGHLAAVSGVQVGIGATALLDRPTFSVVGDPNQLDAQGNISVSKTEPTFFGLSSLPLNASPVVEKQPAFLVRYVDDDHDGKPDLSPLGVPALWPKIFVRKIADPDPSNVVPAVAAGLRDENDLDDDGVLDAAGKSYDHLLLVDGGAPQLIKADAAPDLVILPTAYVDQPIADPNLALVPAQLYAQLALPDGGPDMEAVLPQTTLPVAVLPQAVDASGLIPVPLAAIPPGRYAVIVEQFTGQTWRVPNELSPAVAPGVGLTPTGSQAFTFTVAP